MNINRKINRIMCITKRVHINVNINMVYHIHKWHGHRKTNRTINRHGNINRNMGIPNNINSNTHGNRIIHRYIHIA